MSAVSADDAAIYILDWTNIAFDMQEIKTSTGEESHQFSLHAATKVQINTIK